MDERGPSFLQDLDVLVTSKADGRAIERLEEVVLFAVRAYLRA